MSVPRVPNFESQRLYDSVDLVNRVGTRSQRQLCVMSLVALMAGERHSDRPDCACPVITAYAIKLNDALDDEKRQKLKPFAPRIIGTQDGYAEERARFLVSKILCDVLPRLLNERCADSSDIAADMQLMAGEPARDAAHRISLVIRRAVRGGVLQNGYAGDLRYLLRAYGRESHELVGTAAAVLLANCARLSTDRTRERWFWSFATDLLDRTCDVGISATRSVADIERMSQQAAAQLQTEILREQFSFPRRPRRRRSLFGTAAD